jgi:uncharacterized repeat protein (TIGR03806 family)
MHRLFHHTVYLGIAALVFMVAVASKPHPGSAPVFKAKERLSEYGFFKGHIRGQQPAGHVLPYRLNTPLFSDYAEKLRFVAFPEGSQVAYNAEEVLDFPIGTSIIKTFYYPLDARTPEKGRRLMETRLLVHTEQGWEAYPYIWDDEQTDAWLDVAGETKLVSWKDEKGKKQTINYIIPNKNQCKGCHSFNNKMMPIGPSARQLNGEMDFEGGGRQNQLTYWQQKGYLSHLPPLTQVPQVPVWDNPASGSLESRARAWLDINCAHCHRKEGPAATSGLFLNIHEQNTTALGIYKTPVAAGRGAGNRLYDIVPGKPDESILVYRLTSADPGEMMPELGRSLVHKESLQLIREWIGQMSPSEKP